MTEPSATTGNTSPAAGTGDAGATQQQQQALDLATLKLDGDKVPEKFRGKTAAEVLKSYTELESRASKAEGMNKQWNEWYQKQVSGRQADPEPEPNRGTTRVGPASGRTGSVNPFEVFEEPQIAALAELFESATKPLVSSVTSIFKESVKSSRPDWSDYEDRATEIFDNMPLQHKLDPKYGWTFAYNMARAEKMGTQPPPSTPNQVGSGGPAGGLKPPDEDEISDAELAWMKKFGIESKEEAKKFAAPKET